MFRDLEKCIVIIILSFTMIPNLFLATPHRKVYQSRGSNLHPRQQAQDAQTEDPEKNPAWTVKSHCIHIFDARVCVRVGIPTNVLQNPRTLLIKRDLDGHRSSKRIKREYDDYDGVGLDYTDNDSDYVDYNDKYQEQIKKTTKQDIQQGNDDMFYEYEDEKNSCKVPKTVKSAEIRCKIWPSHIVCKSYCNYGSTFKEGIVRTHKCKFKENRWSTPFEECSPFVDCYVKLKSPGTLKCTRNEIDKPPACKISCEIYEDFDEIKSKVYTCKANGNWEPSLPFCAEKKGIRTVPPPRKLEHTKIAYP